MYATARQEAEAEIMKWEKTMEVVECVEYASFLVDAAKEVGIAV